MGLFDKFNKDEFLDKAKSTIGNTTQAVKGKVEETKNAYEQKKAEKAEFEKEMTEKAGQISQEIIDTITDYSNEKSLFGEMRNIFQRAEFL